MDYNRMIRKGIGFLIFLYVLIPVEADEGMWLLPLIQEINMERMELMGCELTAEEIYSHEGSSLKDVIGSLDYGSCTAGIISENGLIITNHHCGEDEIQSHSSSIHDYLSDGFWAKTREEELPNPGKTISFVVSMEDVTERVLSMVHHEMTETEREKEIEEVSEGIIKEVTEGTHYEAFVLPFYEGNMYYLIVLETFRDVRLVAAPPESIGSFGGSTDNWEWPRHNADFCLMRIYSAPDGTPADYSTENIPYQTDKFLPISTGGYKENDFTMVMGFPGTTDRYLTSARVREIEEIENINRIRIRKTALEIIEKDMLESDKVRIQYTAKHSRLSNYYKYSIGQNRSFFLLDVAERRKEQEEEFNNWIATDSTLLKKYGDAVGEMEEVIRERREMENALSYLEEVFLLHKAAEIYDFAASALPLYFNELGFGSGEERKVEIMEEISEKAENFFRDFNLSTDKKIANELINQYAQNVEPIYFPGIFSTINKKFKGDIDKYLKHLYSKSVFADQNRFNDFIQDHKHKSLIKDPAFLGAFALYNTYFQILEEYEILEDRYLTASRNYQEGLLEMYPDSSFLSQCKFNPSSKLRYHSRVRG
ncbi:S46 family peptidase [Bacteroidota bacterium]